MMGGVQNVARLCVSFAQYVKDVLKDPHNSRSYDTSWCACTFNVLLHQIVERENSPTFIFRGLEKLFTKTPPSKRL